MTRPLIRMDRVRKEFGKTVLAVEDMTLTINEGDFISLLGPSGCGKSTALRMIAGLLPITAGTVTITPPERMGEQDLGFVFQEPTLMPWTTVYNNVWLPLRLAGINRAEAAERVRAALVEVGLSKFEKSYPRALSGGMKMRVSIARAMVTRPRILLMDEPFAALDEMTRMKLNNDVMRLAAEHGLTVVFVTHSVFESVYLSNRIVVMAARPGRVAADLQVAAPWPRDDSFRTSADYVEECRRV
ncbi:MAG: ABC transporter ATP-binding protein, partial [Gemmobacter sp.]|nr:ABC transporter ATP-binding protein [Gemmobacter sp.]